MSTRRNPYGALVAKLERLTTLDDADRAAIQALPLRVSIYPAGYFLVRESDTTEDCRILLSGYVCRHKLTGDGSRQIVSFHIPGDLLDLQHLLLRCADHNIQTITEAAVAWAPAVTIKALADARPRIAEAMWRDTLIEASIFRERVLNVGRRDAKSRVAHMLCEFAVRCEIAGLGTMTSFDLPMTQEHIADATGLTPVHVNRTLQMLGAEGIIERERRRITIADWQRLRDAGGFDPAYLHPAT